MLPGVRRTAKPVLGRKDGGHVEPLAVQQIHEMHSPCDIGPCGSGHLRHGGLVGQHRDALSPEKRKIGRRVGHAHESSLRRNIENTRNTGDKHDDKPSAF